MGDDIIMFKRVLLLNRGNHLSQPSTLLVILGQIVLEHELELSGYAPDHAITRQRHLTTGTDRCHQNFVSMSSLFSMRNQGIR